jgi:hypothetical protein
MSPHQVRFLSDATEEMAKTCSKIAGRGNKSASRSLKAVAVSSSQVTMYYIFTVGDGVTEAMRIRESWIYVEGARE